MTDNENTQYAFASFLLLAVGFLSACAGLWLAMQHQWAGAAVAALLVFAAAAGLTVLGDRVDAASMTDSVPWTSRELDDEQMRAYVNQLAAELDKDKGQ